MRDLSSGWPLYGLIYYYQPTCGACYSAKATLESLEQTNPHIDIAQLDISRPEVLSFVTEMGIRSTPTITVVKNGVVAASFVGDVSKQTLLDALA